MPPPPDIRQPAAPRPRRRFPHSRAHGLLPDTDPTDWSDQVDWTGTRLRLSEHVGTLTLTPEIAGPYRQGHQGVTDFVTRYAQAAITRHRLERILIHDPVGECLGEVLPPPAKVPF